MPPTTDLSGRTFGRLTAVYVEGTQRGAVHWHCRCECGGVTVVRAANLTSLNTRSCGCLPRGPQSAEARARMSEVARHARTPEHRAAASARMHEHNRQGKNRRSATRQPAPAAPQLDVVHEQPMPTGLAALARQLLRRLARRRTRG